MTKERNKNAEETEIEFLTRMKRNGRVWARRPGTKSGLCSIDMAIAILKGHKVWPMWVHREQFAPQANTHFLFSKKLKMS